MATGLIKKVLPVIVNTGVYHRYDSRPLHDRMVFFESRNGKDMAGNVLRIVKELNDRYPNQYEYYTAAEKDCKKRVRKILNRYGLKTATVLPYNSIRHIRAISRAKYLINDATFPNRFVKREGQVYLNTWHGTPYKCMGVDSASGRHLIDNVQRNLLMSDYLLYPSRYCAEKMTEAYCVDGMYQGVILDEGYPRNAVLFDNAVREKVRTGFGLDNKKVFVYMPTFRETIRGRKDDEQIGFLDETLGLLDGELTDEEVLVVKLHYYVQAKLDLSRFRHIIPFPEDTETYEYLAGCDCLITDYSSIFYDFANTGRKIIRFLYDEEEYEKGRGFYPQPAELPFPIARTVSELLAEMRKSKGYDDSVFRETYCSYDSADSTRRIVDHVFDEKKVCRERSIHTDDDRVIIYAGSLAMNGLTTSLQNHLQSRGEKDKRKYYVCFCREIVKKNPENTARIPEGHPIFSLYGGVYPTVAEVVSNRLFFRHDRNGKWVQRNRDRLYQRELRRSFNGTDFSAYIQFAGYDRHVTGLFQRANGKRCIFVHSDMIREIETRQNQSFIGLQCAYQTFDSVAVVNEPLIAPTEQIGGRRDNIRVVHNCIDVGRIKSRASGEISEDPFTKIVCADSEGIEGFLRNHSPNIITVGRFSTEKAHVRLIGAFERFAENHPEAGLIIIGGDGPEFEATVARTREGALADSVLLIRDITNPMPILARCDLFVLASLYEGLPMTLLEADCLGIPNVATDMEGTNDFRRKYHGAIVPNDDDGIVEAMEAYMRGEIGTMDIDYEEYNRNCRREFEELFT